jgi:hypothetical protein
VRSERAQEPCEGLLPDFIEMALTGEKHNAMAQHLSRKLHRAPSAMVEC